MSGASEQPESSLIGIAPYAACCAALLACAAYIGLQWAALPERMPVFITLFGEVVTSAPKTLWTAMRLPFMGLLTVAIIAVAHVLALKASASTPQRRAIRFFFTGVLTALAFKMIPNILSLQYVSEGRIRGTGLVLHYLASVIALAGVVMILVALVQLRATPFCWRGAREKRWAALLTVLCCSYAAAVFAPIT